MIARILPILLAIIGISLGAAAGLLLRSPPEATAAAPEPQERDPNEPNAGFEYVRLQNQFIVPIVRDGRVRANVLVALGVEVAVGKRTRVLEIEPALRDAFLEELLSHASNGGFDDSFTSPSNLETLRRALMEAARASTGSLVTNVQIVELGRQDI